MEILIPAFFSTGVKAVLERTASISAMRFASRVTHALSPFEYRFFFVISCRPF